MSHLFRAITKILIFTNSLWDELSLGEYYGKESLYFCSAPMTFPYILHRYLLLAAAGSRTVAKMHFLCFLIWYSVFPGLNLTSRSRHLWDLTNWAMKIIKKKKVWVHWWYLQHTEQSTLLHQCLCRKPHILSRAYFLWQGIHFYLTIKTWFWVVWV